MYLATTDKIVAFGSATKCAKQLGKTILGFHSLVSKNRLGKHLKYIISDDDLREDSADG